MSHISPSSFSLQSGVLIHGQIRSTFQATEDHIDCVPELEMEIKLIHGPDTINRKLEKKRKENMGSDEVSIQHEDPHHDSSVAEYKILDRKPFRPINSSSHKINRSETFTDGRTGMDNWYSQLQERRRQDEGTPVPQVTPRWQTRWEKDRRPTALNKSHRIKSVSAPNILETSLTMSNVESQQKGKRKEKMRRSRYYRNGYSPVSNSDKENEKFDQTSVKSTQIDQDYMLHKTCARSNNLCVQTRRLWNLDPKSTSRFLSSDAYTKDVNIKERDPVPKDSKLGFKHRRFIRVKPSDDFK